MPQVKGHQAGLFSVGAGSGLCALQAFDGLNEAHPPCEGFIQRHLHGNLIQKLPPRHTQKNDCPHVRRPAPTARSD